MDSFSLRIDYPVWFLLLCITAGLVIAWITYRKNRITQDGSIKKWPVWLLFSLRFIAFSLISFLLLSPFIKSANRQVEKPVIVLAVDNSESVLLNKDSTEYRENLSQKARQLSEELDNNYDVDVYAFGPGMSQFQELNFEEKETNISAVFSEINDRYTSRNIGAVVLASDGVYNRGSNPVYSATLSVPVYAVALGDTIAPRDIVLRNVKHNKVVYLGNDFPLQALIRAREMEGENSRLTVRKGGNVLFSKKININKKNFEHEEDIFLEAKEPGVQRYTVSLDPVEGEISTANNTRDVFIEVLDTRKKILVLGQSPHPDLGVLKNIIEKNQNYEAETELYSNFQRNRTINKALADAYHLVVLHQVPGTGQGGTELLSLLKEQRVPVLHILGGNSSLRTFNELQTGLQVMQTGNSQNNVLPVLNQNFNLFYLSTETQNIIKKLPPLSAPYGDYRQTAANNVLLHQQIGRVETEMPLLTFINDPAQKTAILAGEGIWRWYLYNYRLNGNHAAVEELVGKTIQFLSLQADKRLFRVDLAKNVYNENEQVQLDAYLYNESYEPVKGAQINLTIKSEDEDNEYEYVFRELADRYEVNAGFLPPANYSYSASAKVGDKTYRASGSFVVRQVDLEAVETVADHRLLYNLASQTGGEMVNYHNMQQVAQLIQQREEITPVSYMSYEIKELIHQKWIFFLILIFLSAEWFLRKYYGSY